MGALTVLLLIEAISEVDSGGGIGKLGRKKKQQRNQGNGRSPGKSGQRPAPAKGSIATLGSKPSAFSVSSGGSQQKGLTKQIGKSKRRGEEGFQSKVQTKSKGQKTRFGNGRPVNRSERKQKNNGVTGQDKYNGKTRKTRKSGQRP